MRIELRAILAVTAGAFAEREPAAMCQAVGSDARAGRLVG
jgi:hypothetical protein